MAEDSTHGLLDREIPLQQSARIPSDGSSKNCVVRQSQRSQGESFIVSIQYTQPRIILFQYFEEIISGIDARQRGLANAQQFHR